MIEHIPERWGHLVVVLKSLQLQQRFAYIASNEGDRFLLSFQEGIPACVLNRLSCKYHLPLSTSLHGAFAPSQSDPDVAVVQNFNMSVLDLSTHRCRLSLHCRGVCVLSCPCATVLSCNFCNIVVSLWHCVSVTQRCLMSWCLG